ncbi:MAG: helix-turn-helix transcriptional regulator [Clostridia bacterium]|nr:helix-turn-helix transcriptional regulator [Clostridia bacterium]
MSLGRRIQTLRKQQGLTQDALAEIMGISPQAVSKWENSQSCPSWPANWT